MAEPFSIISDDSKSYWVKIMLTTASLWWPSYTEINDDAKILKIRFDGDGFCLIDVFRKIVKYCFGNRIRQQCKLGLTVGNSPIRQCDDDSNIFLVPRIIARPIHFIRIHFAHTRWNIILLTFKNRWLHYNRGSNREKKSITYYFLACNTFKSLSLFVYGIFFKLCLKRSA